MTLDAAVRSTPFRHGPPITPGFESAIDYVEEAKSRLENKNGGFKSFCKVLYQIPQKTFDDIQHEVGSIMEGESDLVSGFRGFLPSISSVTPPRTLKIRMKRKIFDALHAVAYTGPICSSTVDSPDLYAAAKRQTLQLRCIRRTYMDDRIIEQLCMKPKMAIPIILGRLIKKEEELEKHISYYDRFCSKLFTKRLC
ncbi:hypothetical protein QJS10_CPB15g01832 [Acorus calamus]|uniref:Uncharacterized protein n=1 Tax=Acorus calamus TaxID=4465 RepID=A0AAV9D9Z9_ACOCL|nr:hypothetical protein QJS10_CPB15g01832 [Acorus calamus]